MSNCEAYCKHYQFEANSQCWCDYQDVCEDYPSKQRTSWFTPNQKCLDDKQEQENHNKAWLADLADSEGSF